MMQIFDKFKNRFNSAARLAIKLLFTPFIKSKSRKLGPSASRSFADYFDIDRILFSGLPDHYPFHKKLALLKSQSRFGKIWDALLVTLSVFACAFYVAGTYDASYFAVMIYSTAELVITQFFLADFLFSFFSSASYFLYLTNPWTIVDMLTIAPIYISIGSQVSGRNGTKKFRSLSILRFVRILRLVRILRTFKLLGGLTGVRRQIIMLSLTLTSMVFMAAGIIQLLENDAKQAIEYQCTHIGPNTNWAPSCSNKMSFDVYQNVTGLECDCFVNNCRADYSETDLIGQPSIVTCQTLTFLDAFYYMVVTGIRIC